MTKQQPGAIKFALLTLVIIIVTYLFSACSLVTGRTTDTVANTSWRAEDQYVYFYQSTGLYDNSGDLIEFTYEELDGYVQATYGEHSLEFTHLKGGKLFLVTENTFFYAYQTALSQAT